MSIIFEGFLTLGSNGEEDDILFLNDDNDAPFVEILEDKIGGKCLTVRYYLANQKVTLEQAEEFFIRQFYGDLNADYGMSYSEYTGYLWTTEELKIGGHNLLDELKDNIGKYLILVIDIDEKAEKIKETGNNWRRAKSTLRSFDSYAEKLGLTRNELIKELDNGK